MNISTSLSALGRGILDVGSAVGGALLQAAPAFAPLIAQAIAPKPKNTYAAQPYGGAYPMANVSTTYLPGGSMIGYPPSLQGISGLATSLMGNLGGGGALPEPSFGQSLLGVNRLPKLLAATDPRGNARTYVLAPMVNYKVSVKQRGRRRCSGGR